MTLKQIEVDFVPYIDSEGLIDLDPNRNIDNDGLLLPGHESESPNTGGWRESGNSLAYLATAQIILSDNDCPNFLNFISPVVACQIEPGLYNRSPGLTNNLEAHDDYLGIASLSVGFAVGIFHYGRSHGWSFNNVSPGKWTFRTWQARFPEAIRHYRIMAGRNIISPAGFLVMLDRCFRNRDVNGELLTWIMFKGQRNAPGRIARYINKKLYNIWLNKINRTHGSVKKLFAKYFNPASPFVTYVTEKL